MNVSLILYDGQRVLVPISLSDGVDIARLSLTTTPKVHGLGWSSHRKVRGDGRIPLNLNCSDVDSILMSLNS